ncbi:MAG: FKBP-type peptidyl-prolyl cis-trans isomerase [Chlamydiota bacterium]|jgi:FKBP-type peptidyl-prolyl cis-trans isomerase 2
MIEDGKQVSLEYSVFLQDGKMIDSNVGEEPVVFLQGSHQILPALEEAIRGLREGDTKKITLLPAQAYGEVDPEAFRDVDPNAIPEQMRYEGAILGVQDEFGQQYRIRIHEIKEDKVVVDFNHPLAGQTLTFDMKILAVQEGQA